MISFDLRNLLLKYMESQSLNLQNFLSRIIFSKIFLFDSLFPQFRTYLEKKYVSHRSTFLNIDDKFNGNILEKLLPGDYKIIIFQVNCILEWMKNSTTFRIFVIISYLIKSSIQEIITMLPLMWFKKILRILTCLIFPHKERATPKNAHTPSNYM